MNLATAIDTFLSELEKLNYSKRTIKGYKQDLEMLEEVVCLQNCEVNCLTSEQVEVFLDYSVQVGKSPSSSYRNRRLSCLRSFFSLLTDKKIITSKQNPTTSIKFARVVNRKPSPLSYAEYLSILEAVKKEKSEFLRKRNWSIIVMFYNTGLRLSELSNLDINQIDFHETRILSLKRKGNKVVDFPINRNVVLSLSSWVKTRGTAIDNALFTTSKNRRISTRMIERLVKRYADLAGIDRSITPHTFRHSYCTEIQKRGAGMYIAQELMNHSSIKTTSRYSHVNDADMRIAMDSLIDSKQWPED